MSINAVLLCFKNILTTINSKGLAGYNLANFIAHSFTHMYTCIHTHTCTQAHTGKKHTLVHTHTCTHTLTHTHTHTHTQHRHICKHTQALLVTFSCTMKVLNVLYIQSVGYCAQINATIIFISWFYNIFHITSTSYANSIMTPLIFKHVTLIATGFTCEVPISTKVQLTLNTFMLPLTY